MTPRKLTAAVALALVNAALWACVIPSAVASVPTPDSATGCIVPTPGSHVPCPGWRR
jgi:hypothetical protein